MIVISNKNLINNCLFFYYFFLSFYIICISLLIYILIRLLKYYLKQKRKNLILDRSILFKLYDINEEDNGLIRNDFDMFQPLIIKTLDLPVIFMDDDNANEPPPDYQEYV